MRRISRSRPERLLARVLAVGTLAVAAVLQFSVAPSAFAQASPASDAFAIRAGRIVAVSPDLPDEIVDGTIIVRDGRIVAIGTDVVIPPGMRTIDLPDATIMPGLVAAASGIVGNHQGSRSVGAGHRAIDGFDRYASNARTLEGGVTTVHLNPGRHRLVTGRGAVVRLAGPPESRTLRADSDLTLNLGEPAFGPPMLTDELVPPASDRAIVPDRPQRPSARMAQLLALNEAVEAATEGGGPFDFHRIALAEAWALETPLRIQVQRATDALSGLAFLNAQGRTGYLVGGAEAALIADRLAEAGIPLVYTVPTSFRRPGGDIGVDPTAIEPDVRDLANLGALTLALAIEPTEALADLRLAAALALRAGLSERRIIEAITIVPARILGVDDRVGSLEPGKDADFVVLSGRPLATSSHVQSVYVQGRVVYRPRVASEAIVVRAGTIWLGPNEYLADGSLLIEDGKILEVGRRVAHPPHARVIDAGPDGFIAPGMIDARGHLGLRGDRSAAAPQISLARLVGLPDDPELRVARAGVTTVMMTPYGIVDAGSQVSAVRTAGRSRDARVIRPTAAVAFDVSGMDPSQIAGRLHPRIDAARKYRQTWLDWEKKVKEWEEAQAKGQQVKTEPEIVVEEVQPAEVDPLSGVWNVTVQGAIIPEPISGRVAVRLTGTNFEGQVVEPPAAQDVEHRIVGTLEGRTIDGRIEVDTGGLGTPTINAQLDGESITGTISIAGISVNLTGERVEKGLDAAPLTRRRRVRDEEGRPLPPPVNESLEPMRAVIEKKIPLLIEVRTAAQIHAVLRALTGDNEVPFVLVGADEASVHAEALREREIGVILRPEILRTVNQERRVPGIELSRMGISFAFQSGAEDGARTLPQVGLFAVERGLSPERALAAMTIDAARLLKLDDRIGSIAAGRDADLVIYSGHPFEAGTVIRRVIVNGEDLQP